MAKRDPFDFLKDATDGKKEPKGKPGLLLIIGKPKKGPEDDLPLEKGKQPKKASDNPKTPIKDSGTYRGKSNKPGMGGRSAQLEGKLEKKGESKKEAGAVAGMIARKKGEAPGQPGYK